MTPDNRAYADGQTWHKVSGRDVLIERDGPQLKYWAYRGEQVVTVGIHDRHEEDVLKFLGQLYRRDNQGDDTYGEVYGYDAASCLKNRRR